MYENFPSAMQKNRPRDRSLGTVSLGGVIGGGPPDETGRAAADDHIYQNPSRLTQQSGAMMRSRGASVDRYREYLTPQYYDENYYVTSREDNERRVTVKHIGMPGPGSEPGRWEEGGELEPANVFFMMLSNHAMFSIRLPPTRNNRPFCDNILIWDPIYLVSSSN